MYKQIMHLYKSKKTEAEPVSAPLFAADLRSSGKNGRNAQPIVFFRCLGDVFFRRIKKVFAFGIDKAEKL